MSKKTDIVVSSPEGSLSRYLQEIRKFPMLEAQEEYQLAKDYAEQGDLEAANKLVTSHLRLSAKIAIGYRGYGLPMGEVISEGNLGLMQAVKKFDPERGFRLATYAMWWIRASIQEYVLRSWSLVKIGTTAAQKKLFFNLRRLKGEINAIDEGLPVDKVKEIAKTLNVSETEVVNMNNRLTGGDQSLNAPLRDGEESGEWQDWLQSDDENIEDALVAQDEYDHRQAVLQKAMRALNEREQAILTARRLSEPSKTLEELAQEFSISRERVRQIEQRAFEKLRDAMQELAQAEGIIEADPQNN